MNRLTVQEFIAQGMTPAQIASIAAAYPANRELRAVADEVALQTGLPGGYVRRYNDGIERAARRAKPGNDNRRSRDSGQPRNRRAA